MTELVSDLITQHLFIRIRYPRGEKGTYEFTQKIFRHVDYYTISATNPSFLAKKPYLLKKILLMLVTSPTGNNRKQLELCGLARRFNWQPL